MVQCIYVSHIIVLELAGPVKHISNGVNSTVETWIVTTSLIWSFVFSNTENLASHCYLSTISM